MQHRATETEHGLIAYTVTGDVDGQAIVLLPGFQSDQNSWSSRGYPELLADYRVLNVDPVGHGRSARPVDEQAYSADAVVRQVESVLDAEDIERAHIWGFSRGGFIAALCAELAPNRCASAVMGGTPLGAAADLTAPMLAAGEPFLAAGDWLGYWASYPIPLPTALIEHFERSNDPRANAAAIRAMANWPTEVPGFGLNASRIPRFVYFGQGEIFADALRTAVQSCDVDWLEGPWQGHAETMMDANGVVIAVRDFLQRSSNTG